MRTSKMQEKVITNDHFILQTFRFKVFLNDRYPVVTPVSIWNFMKLIKRIKNSSVLSYLNPYCRVLLNIIFLTHDNIHKKLVFSFSKNPGININSCPGQVKISMEIFYDNNLKLKNNLSVYNYANQNLETQISQPVFKTLNQLSNQIILALLVQIDYTLI